MAIEAFLQTVGRKKGERFLRTMAESLATEESLAQVRRIRPPADELALGKARCEAMLWFRQMLPVFLARLDE